jgi:hypothetical protein
MPTKKEYANKEEHFIEEIYACECRHMLDPAAAAAAAACSKSHRLLWYK